MKRQSPNWDSIAKIAVSVLQQIILDQGWRIKPDVSFWDGLAIFTFEGGRTYAIPVSKERLEVGGVEWIVRQIYAELSCLLKIKK